MQELRLDPGETLESAIRTVAGALARAHLEGEACLLVVAPRGAWPAPSTAQRMEMVRSWAAAAGGRVRLAVVADASLLDPERVGVVAARGFGLQGEVFQDEAEARRWLEGPG